MTQIILNPKSVKDSDNLNTWEPEYPIPNAVREWSYCPNFNDWLPGDLILVSAIKPNFIVKAIRSIQKKVDIATMMLAGNMLLFILDQVLYAKLVQKGLESELFSITQAVISLESVEITH